MAPAARVVPVERVAVAVAVVTARITAGQVGSVGPAAMVAAVVMGLVVAVVLALRSMLMGARWLRCRRTACWPMGLVAWAG